MILTDEDRERALRIAHDRHDTKLGKVRDRRYDTRRSGIEINYLGILAEITTEKELGLPVDESISLHGDGGLDSYSGDLTFQIKYNTYLDGDLYVNSLNTLSAHIYILVVGDEHEMFTVGWAYQKDFTSRSVKKNYGYGTRVAIPQSNLRRTSALRVILDRSEATDP